MPAIYTCVFGLCHSCNMCCLLAMGGVPKISSTMSWWCMQAKPAAAPPTSNQQQQQGMETGEAEGGAGLEEDGGMLLFNPDHQQQQQEQESDPDGFTPDQPPPRQKKRRQETASGGSATAMQPPAAAENEQPQERRAARLAGKASAKAAAKASAAAAAAANRSGKKTPPKELNPRAQAALAELRRQMAEIQEGGASPGMIDLLLANKPVSPEVASCSNICGTLIHGGFGCTSEILVLLSIGNEQLSCHLPVLASVHHMPNMVCQTSTSCTFLSTFWLLLGTMQHQWEYPLWYCIWLTLPVSVAFREVHGDRFHLHRTYLNL